MLASAGTPAVKKLQLKLGCFLCDFRFQQHPHKEMQSFDADMSKVWLEEEKIIVMREMSQHCTYLRSVSESIRTKTSEVSPVRDSSKKLTFVSLLLVLGIISICSQQPLQILVKNTTNAS